MTKFAELVQAHSVPDAEAKLKMAVEALQHIAIKQAKDGQAKYAIAKQALEKIAVE